MRNATHSLKLFTAVLLCSFGYGTLQAQQSVSITGDSINSSSCPLPAYVGGSVSGIAENYNSATDSIIVEFFWGDGTTTKDTVPLIEAGTTDLFQSSQSHSYTLPGSYQVMVVATTPNNLADTTYWGGSINVSTYCTQFDGYVYDDLNSNCSYDSGTDSLYSNVYVRATNSSGQVVGFDFSNNGYYNLYLPSNLTNVTLTAHKIPSFSVVCPTAGSYTFNSNTSQSFDFALECNTNDIDKSLHVWSVTAAPGDTGNVYVYGSVAHCVNPGSVQDTVTVMLDSDVTYIGMGQTSSAPAPNVTTGNQLTWYVNWSNNTNNSSTILSANILTTTNTNATMFDTACYTANFASNPNDVNPLNDVGHTCDPIGAPYDPNNKLASPQGEGPSGLIDTSHHQLTYRINFQNTGTAPAQNVYVLDTMPQELDIETIQILEASHDMKVIYQNDNRFRFDFPNINLADSGSSEEGSKGHVTFSINRDPSLSIGTQIKNRVGIYFDYNAPVITDYAINTLYVAPDEPDPDSLVVDLEVSDVTCKDNDNGSIDLSIVSGNSPYTYNWSNGNTTQDVEILSPGVYSVTVTDSEQQTAEAEVEVGENRIHDAPILGNVTGSFSVEAWKPYVYEVEQTSGSTYTWSASGGDIANQANNQVEVLWRAGPQGLIVAEEKDENGCIGMNEMMVSIIFVGIPEGHWEDMKVYPNPTEGMLNVQLPQGLQNADLSLFDAQGRMVLNKTMNANATSLNVNDISKGVYWLNVDHEGSNTKVKIVVN